jgi:hypothetical protein
VTNKHFFLNRKVDISGISGTGHVAEGFVFDNGVVAMTWLTKFTSTTVYQSIEHVEQIHGHEGATEIEWVE